MLVSAGLYLEMKFTKVEVIHENLIILFNIFIVIITFDYFFYDSYYVFSEVRAIGSIDHFYKVLSQHNTFRFSMIIHHCSSIKLLCGKKRSIHGYFLFPCN
jgi:hypothetical protein